MTSTKTTENGTTVLLPYAMPESLNADGERQEQGRYCIAYSRDGWWIIDSENMLALSWCPSEEDAVAIRDSLITRRA